MFKTRICLVGLFILLGSGFTALVIKSNFYELTRESVPQEIDLSQTQSQLQPDKQDLPQILENSASPDLEKIKSAISPEPPKDLNLKMPFFSQAPFGDWDLPWQEACEEASILLINNVYNNRNYTKNQFRDEILKLVEWQNKRFGDYKHTDVSQMQIMLKEYFGLESKVLENPTFQDLKVELAAGRFILLPLAGKTLNNPFYSNGGPIYHVLPVKGYKSEGQKLITNDVGTRRGENYIYSFENIKKSLHDYAEPISKGPSRALVVYPLMKKSI